MFWFVLYQTLIPVSEALMPALPASHPGSALQFFFYDTPKVLLLLAGIVFLMGIVHTSDLPGRALSLAVVTAVAGSQGGSLAPADACRSGARRTPSADSCPTPAAAPAPGTPGRWSNRPGARRGSR